ncbi:MAG: ABC transporter permease [Rhizobiales bacterium]|nr:ABC transporter permease [Hyphomicrobiales bacterium]
MTALSISERATARPRREAFYRARTSAAAIPAIVLVIVMVGPFVWLACLSFVSEGHLSLANYQRMIDNPSYWKIIVATFQLSAIVSILTVILGYPTAYLIKLLPPRLATIALGCVLVPFWTSLLVRTYAWMVLLQRNGVINDALIALHIVDTPLRMANTMGAAVVGMVHIMLPFLILPLYASMKAIDPDLTRAAAGLGASPTRSFFQVFLPLSLPGVFAGMILVFVLCLGFYVTPQLLGGGNVVTISMKIQHNVAMYADWGAASALGVILLLAIALIPLVAKAMGAAYAWRMR